MTLDDDLKRHFAKRRPRAGRDADAVSPEDVLRFVSGEMPAEELERFLERLSQDPDARDAVRIAREAAVVDPARIPSKLLERAKALRPGVSARRRFVWAWLAAAAISFAGSFAFPRWFLQFLALALFFGIKWIVEERAARSQVLLFKALSEEGQASDKRLQNRNPRL